MIPKNAIKKVKNEIHLEIAAGALLAYGVFPQTQEGIQLAKETAASKDTWLAPSGLPEYYDGIDSDLIVGKENDAILAIRKHLKEFYGISSAGSETATDTRVPEEVIQPPINIPPAHYIQGQAGRWNPEFESDIDHAVYFAGKSPNPKGAKQREVLEWLKNSGLTFEQIHDHREKVLEKIRETIALPGVEEEYPYVYIDAVDQDFVIDEEIEEEDEEEDYVPEGLDDLLDFVRVEEEPADEENEVESQAEVATQVLVEAENAREESIDESVLDDLPDDVKQSLVNLINKRTGKSKPTQEKKPSNYISNRKIFNFLTNNLLKIQGQLDSVNNNIIRQNELLQANLQVSSGIYENIEIQNTIFLSKLDQILQAVGGQSEAAKKYAEDEEKRLAEENLEASRDAAGTETAMSTLGKKGTGGNSLLRRLTKFFGKRLGRMLWRRFAPRRLRARARLAGRNIRKITSLPKRLAQSLGSRIAGKVLQKPAQVAVKNVAPRAVAKGFEHIALPGVNKAMKNADAPVAKAVSNSDNFLGRVFKSPVIQKALVNKLGKEGAEKLTVKVAAKLIPGVSTAYGLGEGLARIAMGDLKGGFLSFGSAIPGAGYAFAAIDILRDINIDAYTKHIESNLPLPSNENFAAFFTEALGVTPDQYELGGTTGSQTVMLHGTELLIPPASPGAGGVQSVDPVGGIILAASAQYINKLGPVGAPIAPMFEQVAAPLTKVYDVPSTLVQTNVGGSLPSLQATLKKIKERKKMTPEEELSAMEKDLLEEQDPGTFADKLLKMLDPQGKFRELLRNLNNGTVPSGQGGEVSAEPFVLLGGSQDPKQAGIDFTLKGTQNRAVLSGTVVEIKHQYDANATGGDGRRGAGYGNYIVIRSTNPLDGSQVDMLYAHFPKGEIKVKEGDQVSVGQDLGRMATAEEYANPATRKEVGSGTGPHTSLDFFKPGSNQAHPGARALGGYILSELGKGDKGAMEKARQQAYQQQQSQNSQQPTGEYDVILPLDHVKPGNENKIPDTKGGNTFKNASATGAAGRERQHQDNAAAKIKAKLEAKGLRVKILAPEDFGNYEDYDKYISSQASKGVRIVPLHFDAAVGQGGTGFLTRTRKGDTADASLARPIQQALSSFQRSNPSLGNLGPTDTASNATINRASAAPATLVEMGSMVAWEKQHGSNFTSTSTFDKLATGISEGIYQGGGFNRNMRPPTQRQPAQSKYYLRQGGDNKTDTQIIMIPASSNAGKAIEKNATVEGQRFVYDANYNVFKTQNEVSSVERANLLRRLGLN